MPKIGNYSLYTIETGRFGLDGGAMFGIVPKPLWERRRFLLIRKKPHSFKYAMPVDLKGEGRLMLDRQRVRAISTTA